MSDNESKDRHEKIVYWPEDGHNEFGEYKLGVPTEVKARVERRKRVTSDPQKQTVDHDHILNVDRDMTEGGTIYLGSISDLTAGNSVDTLRIVDFEKVPDIKGRKFDRHVMVKRDRNKAITVVPLLYNAQIAYYNTQPLFYNLGGRRSDEQIINDDPVIPTPAPITNAARLNAFKAEVNGSLFNTLLTSYRSAITTGSQWPYYNFVIIEESLINAWKLTGDTSYLDSFFAYFDDLKAHAESNPVARDLAGLGDSYPQFGYSNPQTASGATLATYFAWPNIPMLWAAECSAAIMTGCHRVLIDAATSGSYKSQARAAIEWTGLHVQERYATSVGGLYNQMNQKVEQMATGLNGAGTAPVVWDDKPALIGIGHALYDYWLGQWGTPKPTWLTTDLGFGFAGQVHADYKRWWELLLGARAGETSPLYSGRPYSSWSTINGSGASVIAGQAAFDDVAHDRRRPQWTQLMKALGLVSGGGLTTATNHLAAFERNIQLFIYAHPTKACAEVHQNSDGTTDVPTPEDIPAGENFPVAVWGSFAPGGDTGTTSDWYYLSDHLEYPCAVVGNDALNKANIYSWAAMAEQGVSRADIYGAAY